MFPRSVLLSGRSATARANSTTDWLGGASWGGWRDSIGHSGAWVCKARRRTACGWWHWLQQGIRSNTKWIDQRGIPIGTFTASRQQAKEPLSQHHRMCVFVVNFKLCQQIDKSQLINCSLFFPLPLVQTIIRVYIYGHWADKRSRLIT